MVSCLLATTGRPEMAERCVESLERTTWGVHDIEIIAAVDADRVTRDILHSRVDVLDYSPKLRGAANAWNDCLALATGDPIVLVADDLIFQDGWLDAALERLAEFPDGWGMVGFNDGNWGEELSTHYLMSSRFIREVLGGVIAWPCYQHSFHDRETNERARLAGRYAWCEQARVSHQHWLFGDRPQDNTDIMNLGGHPASERTFQQRAAAGFPNDFEAVI